MNCAFLTIIFFIWILNESVIGFLIQNETQPVCDREWRDSRIMIQYTDGFIICCMFVYNITQWSFKQESEADWNIIIEDKSRYEFSYNRKQLRVIQPKEKIDSGQYKCEYVDYFGEVHKNTTKVTVDPNVQEHLNIVETNDQPAMYLKNHFDYGFYCIALVTKRFNFKFIWNRGYGNKRQSIIEGLNLRRSVRRALLTNGYSGFASLTKIPDNYENMELFNFSVHLTDLKESAYNLLSCQIIFKDLSKEHVFQLFFESKKSEIGSIVASLIVSVVGVFIIIYVFQYDIKIIILKCLRGCLNKGNNKLKNNFFLLYDYENSIEFQMVFNIVKRIEKFGFTTYFYHRDQIYGKVTLEELIEELENSNTIVILFSSNLWADSTCKFCFQTIINKCPNRKRRYICFQNKQQIMKSCNIDFVTADVNTCMSSNVYYWNIDLFNCYSISNFIENWHWHRLISWLIASLSYKCM